MFLLSLLSCLPSAKKKDETSSGIFLEATFPAHTNSCWLCFSSSTTYGVDRALLRMSTHGRGHLGIVSNQLCPAVLKEDSTKGHRHKDRTQPLAEWHARAWKDVQHQPSFQLRRMKFHAGKLGQSAYSLERLAQVFTRKSNSGDHPRLDIHSKNTFSTHSL